MQTDTPEALLEAVGVNPDTRGDIFDYVTKCDGCGDYTGAYPDGYKCSRCNGTHHFVENRYTGPALHTPELDAILWVEGQRWLICQPDESIKWKVARSMEKSSTYELYFDDSDSETTMPMLVEMWLLYECVEPGHALARAIKEIAT